MAKWPESIYLTSEIPLTKLRIKDKDSWYFSVDIQHHLPWTRDLIHSHSACVHTCWMIYRANPCMVQVHIHIHNFLECLQHSLFIMMSLPLRPPPRDPQSFLINKTPIDSHTVLKDRKNALVLHQYFGCFYALFMGSPLPPFQTSQFCCSPCTPLPDTVFQSRSFHQVLSALGRRNQNWRKCTDFWRDMRRGLETGEASEL